MSHASRLHFRHDVVENRERVALAARKQPPFGVPALLLVMQPLLELREAKDDLLVALIGCMLQMAVVPRSPQLNLVGQLPRSSNSSTKVSAS